MRPAARSMTGEAPIPKPPGIATFAGGVPKFRRQTMAPVSASTPYSEFACVAATSRLRTEPPAETWLTYRG
jgi:hypothetical protein